MIADCSNLIRDLQGIKELLQRKQRGELTELEQKHLTWTLRTIVAVLRKIDRRAEGVLVRELQRRT